MSAPRILAQILILGSQIVGKAFLEAGRQAARNARAGRVEAGAAAGAPVAGANTGNSVTDQLTRAHRMTLDEARMILNLKKGENEAEALIKSYEHLFKTNAPPAPKGQPGGGAGSFYLQSKIVRARERIEAEWEGAKKKESGEADAAATGAAESSGESPGPGQGR